MSVYRNRRLVIYVYLRQSLSACVDGHWTLDFLKPKAATRGRWVAVLVFTIGR